MSDAEVDASEVGEIANDHQQGERFSQELNIQEAGHEAAEWIEKYDDTYNLYYYSNIVTGECQWDSPFATNGHEEMQVTYDQDYIEKHSHDEDATINVYEEAKYNDERVHNAIVDSYDEHQDHPNQHANQEQQFEYPEQQNYTDAWNERNASQPVYYTQEEQDYPYDYEDSDEANDLFEHHDYEPYDEETAPKAVKDRSKDRLPTGTNQDYVHMARMYKLTRPYSDPDYTALCVLCHTNFADMVFFPCEHRCVCSECIHNESICSDTQMESTPHGYCNCSLCAGIIKLILPSEGGAEVEKYWNWVYEEQIPLPSNFLRNFRHSAGVIRAVHVRNSDGKDVDSFENASKSCAIS